MKKKLLVAGSRYFTDYEKAKAVIDRCVAQSGEREFIILSGGCRGTDLLGERYAEERGWEIRRYLPEWQRYGRGAGPKRNKTMVESADYVICFWDGGNGTKSTIAYAEQLNKPLWVEHLPSDR